MNLSFEDNDIRKTSEALLLLNDFLIDNKLKEFDSLPSKQQTKVLETITCNFESFDNLMNTVKTLDTPEFLKKYLENITDDGLMDENIEVTHSLLLQKANYIKGKFMLKCKYYQEALEFFLKSRETSIICDAKIIAKSLKKIIQIIDEISMMGPCEVE